MTRRRVFLNFVLLRPVEKIGSSDLFDVIQDIFHWHSGILVDIVFPTLGT